MSPPNKLKDMNELQGRPRRVKGRTRFQGQAAKGSSVWLKVNPCTPESRKRGRRNPLQALKSQEFVRGRVGTNSGSWCAESRRLSGNTHEKKRQKEKMHSWNFCWFGWEKNTFFVILWSKEKKKTPSYLELSETAYSDTKTITKQKDSEEQQAKWMSSS